jgi:predicted dehydrogenase
MFEAVGLARSQGRATRYYRIYTDLLADREIDAVIVATPDFWHARMTLEAIRAGKDVYLERPLSLTWQQGLELAAAERESTQIIQVGSQVRSSSFLSSRDSARTGRIRAAQAAGRSDCLRPGVLRRGGFKLPDPLNFVDWQAAAVQQVSYNPDRFLNWRYYSLYGGGIVTDLGFPIMDLVDAMCAAGVPLSVTATGVRSSEEGFDTVESANITVEFQAMRCTMTLSGTASQKQCSVKFEGNTGSFDAGAKFQASEHDSTRRHLAAFFDSVRTRRPPNATIRSTLPATLICHMANLSITSGQPAWWNAAQSRVEIHR